MVEGEGPKGGAIDRARIQSELDAVFHTPEFERAPVMRRLLEFLIQTTLAGHGDELKAYTVAVEGLGRDPDFDSQSDSYPRVQVGRLRKMLDAHYANAPPVDGFRFYVKPGGYKVDFAAPETPSPPSWRPPVWEEPDRTPRVLIGERLRNSSPALSSPFPWRLLIAGLILLAAFTALVWIVQSTSGIRAPMRRVAQAPVLELGAVSASGGPEARQIALATSTLLEDALHRAWLVRLREARPNDGRDVPEADRPVYRLTGRVDTSGALGGRRLILLLLDLQTGDQIWSDTLDVTAAGGSLTEVLRPAIVALVSPFGVIATHQRGLIQPVGEPGYACLLEYDQYFRYRDPAMRERVRDCVADTVDREPRDATALAAASFLALDMVPGEKRTGRYQLGVDYARRAVAANPYSADAQVADMRIAMTAGQCVRARALANRALALNPYSPEMAGLIGYMLFGCNDPDAVPLLTRAITDDPDVPTFYSAALILALLEGGDTQTALRVADTIRPPGAGMAGQYAVIQTLASVARGNIAAAKRHWAKAHGAHPATTPPERVLSQYFYLPLLRQRMVNHLRTAGVVA